MGRQRTLWAGVVGAVVLLLLAWFLTRQGQPAPQPTSAGTTTSNAARTTSAARTAAAPGSTASGNTATGGASSRAARTTAAATDPESRLPWVELAQLPPEAARTLQLIDAGGPYPYPGKDGSTYRNLNRMLPRQPDGYYREFTVPTPREGDRGARRIVVGQRGELYWTADHYDTFARIRR